MCGKCHNLTSILANTSWTQHNRHVSKDGFSCSVCHTAHGMGAVVASISGERLVNFDINVAQNQAAPISYNRATNTCTLRCHRAAHNANGTVAVNGLAKCRAFLHLPRPNGGCHPNHRFVSYFLGFCTTPSRVRYAPETNLNLLDTGVA